MAIQITRKKILLIASILVAVIAIAGSLIAWSYFQNQQSESTEVQSAARYEKGTRNIQEAKVENDDPSALVENYESEYYTVQQEISKTEPSKWDQDQCIQGLHKCEGSPGRRTILVQCLSAVPGRRAGLPAGRPSEMAVRGYIAQEPCKETLTLRISRGF